MILIKKVGMNDGTKLTKSKANYGYCRIWNYFSGFVAWIGKTVSSAVSGITNFVIGIIFAFYLLMIKEKIGEMPWKKGKILKRKIR